MDVVYPLKRGNDSDAELRYSLRSLQNLSHDRVFLIGGCPAWADNVEHIWTVKHDTKYKDATNNILTACKSDEVSDPFVLMNDDFFILKHMDEVPVLNRGSVRDVITHYQNNIGDSAYLEGMRNTLRVLETHGYEDPLSFELHVPMVVHKQMRVAAIELGWELPVWHARTAYGALARLQGETISDVKIHTPDRPLPYGPFASTSDQSFRKGMVGTQLRSMFKQPSPYEKDKNG